VAAITSLLLIRHAPAEDAAEFTRKTPDDGLRPLSSKGREKFMAAAVGLRLILPELALLVSSPLLRATQTAEVLASVYDVPVHTTPLLVPDFVPEVLLDFVNSQARGGVIALVGHEPDLGRFAGWMLTGTPAGWIRMKKGTACLLDRSHGADPGCAVLQWSLPMKLLRRLAG